MPRPELHRGKLARHPRIISVRPLTRDDLACLKQGQGRVTPRVKQLSMAHHRIARLVASGLRDHEVRHRTGISSSRLASLKQDPAFQQLTTEYKGKVDQAWLDSQDEFYDTATSNMLRAERMLEQHLDMAEEDGGELIPIKSLLGIIGDRADRFGYGKHSTQTNEVKDFAKIMEQMALRSGRSNVIDGKSNRSPVEAEAPLPDHASPPQAPLLEYDDVGFRRRI